MTASRMCARPAPLCRMGTGAASLHTVVSTHPQAMHGTIVYKRRWNTMREITQQLSVLLHYCHLLSPCTVCIPSLHPAPCAVFTETPDINSIHISKFKMVAFSRFAVLAVLGLTSAQSFSGPPSGLSTGIRPSGSATPLGGPGGRGGHGRHHGSGKSQLWVGHLT